MFKNKHIVLIVISIIVIFSLAACSGQSVGKKDIIDVDWKWTALKETVPASQSVVPEPENYTIKFLSDGTFSAKADCNMVSGSYTIDGNTLTIKAGPSTMAFCGDQSLDQLFLESLGKIASFNIENGQLILSMVNDSGSMELNK